MGYAWCNTICRATLRIFSAWWQIADRGGWICALVAQPFLGTLAQPSNLQGPPRPGLCRYVRGLLQHAHKFAGSLKNAPSDSAAGSANGCFCCWQRIQRALGRRADSKETEPWEYIWVTSGSAVMGACTGCGRRCDSTKIPTSHLCLLFSTGAAFRTHRGL